MQVSAASPKPSDFASSRVGLKVRDREDAIASTRGRVRSPESRYDPAEIPGGALLAMPRLRNVLNPWLADVIHQHEGQSVCVWPAELIHARAFAIFGDFP